MIEILKDETESLWPNREKLICYYFHNQLIFYNIDYSTSIFNLKTKKTIEIKEFFNYFEAISDDTFVGVKQINGEIFFINNNLKIIDKIKLPSTTIQGVFSPSKNILCLVDLDYIFIYSCNPKKLFILTHVKATKENQVCYEKFKTQFFKLSDDLIILYFFFIL